jgi:CubicO group peptidase (beta-lactamase class C family)
MTPGSPIGIAPATLEEIQRFPEPPIEGWHDHVLKVDAAWSLGFSRPLGSFDYGSATTAFGHPGAGGSMGFADPQSGLSYAYVINRLGPRLRDDPREQALRDALYECVGGARGSAPDARAA